MNEIIKRTMSSWLNLDNEENKLIGSISHESKNVFNHYNFCCKLFNEYKRVIYKKLLKHKSFDVNEDILNELAEYYKIRTSNFEAIKNNSQLIYEYIREQNINVYNYNFEELYKKYKQECKLIENIIIPAKHRHMVYFDLIYNILKSRYFRNYYKSRFEMLNKIPLTITDKIFIDHVKSKTTIFDGKNYCDLLKRKYETKENKVTSQQNLIKRFAYKTLTNCKLTGDLICNIMNKCYSAYASFNALKEKGLRVGQIKYLPKDGHYVIPIFSHGFLIEENKIRISIGKEIATEFENVSSVKKKFMYLDLPNYFLNNEACKIKLIEISPKYDGYRYKINIVYDEIITSRVIKPILNKDNFASFDIGVTNLITAYDPLSVQRIIKGSNLTSSNHYFNWKIDKAKSELPSNKGTSKKIRNLLIKRDNVLNSKMNNIVDELYKTYKHKEKIIIGYNEGWKQNVQMGHEMNRKFYDIPFDKLIKKLENKFKGNVVERIKEPYTSKTDALSLENICYHDNYNGKRIHRGLYQSKDKRIINADLNGAINIMRLYCKKEKVAFNQVTGIYLFNPRIMHIK